MRQKNPFQLDAALHESDELNARLNDVNKKMGESIRRLEAEIACLAEKESKLHEQIHYLQNENRSLREQLMVVEARA